MTRMFLMLNKIEDIKKFFSIAQLIPCKIYLQRDEYVIDAHSLMGIFSLDLTKVVTFISDEPLSEDIMNELQQFSVDK